MNQNGRRERSDSIIEFVKKQKSSSRPIPTNANWEPNSGWYNNFYNGPPSLDVDGIDYSAAMTRESSQRANHLIHAAPKLQLSLQAPLQNQTQPLAPSECTTHLSLSLHQQPFVPHPTPMLRSAANFVQEDVFSRSSRSNSHDSHDSWTMPHNDQSFRNNATHEYSDTYMALQAHKHRHLSMPSVDSFPRRYNTMPPPHHGIVPMSSSYLPFDHNMSLERGTLYPCPPSPFARFPIMSPNRDDSWPVFGHGLAPACGTSHTVQGLPALMANSNDHLVLSPHQVFLRLQIEVFAASIIDTSTHMRGRNKPIQLHQVGIRCRYCAHVPISQRQKGHAYYPAALLGLYQAAQNMSTNHMQCGLCKFMPDTIKQRFAELIPSKNTSSGCGRTYWADTARDELGLVDTDDGIFVGRRDRNDL